MTKREALGLWKCMKRPLPSEVIQARFRQLHSYAQETLVFPQDGCFSMTWLKKIIHQADQLWFQNVLLKLVVEAFGGLELRFEEPEQHNVAGYVYEDPERQKLSLYMNRDLFHRLFENRSKKSSYHAGGRVCQDRLSCFLQVLLHELLHVVLTLMQHHGMRVDVQEHGKDFNKLVRNQFDHIESQHGLLPGFEQVLDIHQIRQCIADGDVVEVFLDQKWHQALVLKKGLRYVSVRLAYDKRQFKLNMGLVRPFSSLIISK